MASFFVFKSVLKFQSVIFLLLFGTFWWNLSEMLQWHHFYLVWRQLFQLQFFQDMLLVGPRVNCSLRCVLLEWYCEISDVTFCQFLCQKARVPFIPNIWTMMWSRTVSIVSNLIKLTAKFQKKNRQTLLSR